MERNNRVAAAVRNALILSALTATAGTALAQENIAEVTVTGSRIRRVNFETASPVFVFDSKALSLGGAAVFGDIITRAPSIAGAATSPQVNNGGGTGAQTISLRGLTANRTLLLIDGRRTVSQDVNAIPMNFIERVEILKDGASATYGSDAIGGVVNFITRRDFEGVEGSAQYGESERGDAGERVVSFAMGTTSDKGRFMMGATWNDRKPVSSGDREWSAVPWALYYGSAFGLGSSRIPNGRYLIPDAALIAAGFNPASDPNCTGSSSQAVIRIDGASGGSGSDYRCYIGGGPGNDTFNFQPDNVNVTPQNRYGLFAQGSYDVSENLEAYFSGTFHHTESSFQIAPEAFDSRPAFANTQVSALSYYNPWGDVALGAGNGVDIGDARKRLVDAGLRRGEYTTQVSEGTAGLRGEVADWSWEASATYGTVRQEDRQSGELYTPRLTAAIGPSRLNANDVVECYDPLTGDAIDGCVPYNIFAPVGAPENATALAALVPERHGVVDQRDTHFGANITGDLFELPAGAVGSAFGLGYTDYYLNDQPDFLEQQGLTSGGCCSGAASGSYNISTAYVEFLVPVLKDVPGASSINASLGASYSDYSNFGTTDNYKIGLEYRPVRTLLIRGTFATVFRAPNIYDLFQAPQVSADTFNDPCNGLTAADVAANPNAGVACTNVPQDGTFNQSDSQTAAFYGGNPDTVPEEGDVFTAGFLWNPEFLDRRMEIGVDYYKVSLEDTIGTLGTNQTLSQCFINGLFCNLSTRDAAGDVNRVVNTTQNIGLLDTDGIDFGFRYDFGDTAIGNFRLSLDTTYLLNWENEQIAGDPLTFRERAGVFIDSSSGGDGHFTEWRGLVNLNWAFQDFEAALTYRYIGEVTEFVNAARLSDDNGDPIPDSANCPDAVFAANPDGRCPRDIRAHNFVDVEASYLLGDRGISFTIGANNVTDEKAPIIYSGFNGTTDVRTYDTIGRFYFARMNWKM